MLQGDTQQNNNATVIDCFDYCSSVHLSTDAIGLLFSVDCYRSSRYSWFSFRFSFSL